MSPLSIDFLLSCRALGRRLFALLIDPDSQEPGEAARRAAEATELGADLILVGGSQITSGSTRETVQAIAVTKTAPVILFPGCDSPEATLVPGAAGFLCPVLLSGRDPQYLIEWHVKAAPLVRSLGLRSMPTAYILIRSQRPTRAEVVTKFSSLDPDNVELIARHAMAGEMMGLSLVYLDAGSGASRCVPGDVIGAVRKVTKAPLIVGGGIRNPVQVRDKIASGADVVVVGNALEESWNRELLSNMVTAAHSGRKIK